MIDSHHGESPVSGRIRLALNRIAGDYPFHACLLEKFLLQANQEVGTMGVTARGDRVLLAYSPEFVMQITLPELGGVLLHEVHHVLFGHIFADAADYPDEWARTVAEEVTVNEFVTEPLPGRPIRLDDYPVLPPLESTDQRYRRLARTKRRDRTPFSALECAPASGAAQEPGTTTPQGQQSAASQKKPSTRRPNQGRPRRGKAAAGPEEAKTVPDNHAVWKESRQDPEQAHAVIQALIEDVLDEVGATTIPEYLRAACETWGCQAGNGETEISAAALGTLDWKHLLRRFVGRHVRIQPDFLRPPRRCPQLVGVIPGRRRRRAKPRVMAVIDTSASITQPLLELINGELSRLARDYDVLVVECDAAVGRVYSYRPIVDVSGGGGTDLRPPLAARFLREQRPDCVVYFTDGFGPAPHKPISVPLLWCLTPSGKKPADWGEQVQMATKTAPNAG